MTKLKRNVAEIVQAPRKRQLIAAGVVCCVVVAAMIGEVVQALRAPVTSSDGTATYYYVSNNIKDNGDFPVSYVAFYWPDDEGDKTITYTGKQCNGGGYGDDTDSNVSLTLYGIKTNGTVDYSNIIIEDTPADCHSGQSSNFEFNLRDTNYDSKIGLKGVVARVSMNDTGRAFFTLNTDNAARFGALGAQTIGYSRDFDANQPGFYTMTLNFGTLCSASSANGYIRFYDVDHGNKYQSETMTFRIKNVDTGTWVSNSSSAFSNMTEVNATDGNSTTFDITAGSGEQSALRFTMQANTRYALEIRDISDMNDIAVSVPTNEIYGKLTCGEFTANPSIQASVNNGTTWQSSDITASPGTTIRWQHRFTTSGLGDPPNITYGYGDDTTTGTKIVVDDDDAWSYNPTHNSTNGHTDASPWKDSSSYTIPLTTANGTKYCRQTYNTPKSSANDGRTASGELCVTVAVPPANNELSPYVNSSRSTVSPNEVVTFTYSAHNTGDAAGSGWLVRQIVIPETMAYPADFGVMHFNWSCSNYIAAGIACSDSSTLSGSKNYASNATETIASEPVTVTGAVGTRICRVLVVNPYKSGTTTPRDSAVSCVLIAAAPYVSVIGGDVWSGGSTEAPYTSVSGQGQVTGAATQGAGFGSFSEYGVFATGQVNYFGSAGRPGSSSSATGGVDGTKLTFASASGGGLSLGKFTSSHAITNLKARYASAAHTASVLSGSTVAGSGVYVASGDITLSGMSGRPKAVIYAPNNTVTLTGNLVYDTAGAVTFQDLPSLTIIAKSILVDANVTQIDGNFYAVNTFVSCAQGPTSAGASAAITASGECNKQLVINGALTVVGQTATSLVLNRSYGGTKAGEAAELLRMRPEVYLTPHESSASSFLLTTVQESELPPRY